MSGIKCMVGYLLTCGMTWKVFSEKKRTKWKCTMCVCHLSQCLRTQPTAGWSLLTADVWYSPLFHFVSATVFLSWHFRLIQFSRLIIAALQKPHHSARATFQQTCSSFLTDSYRFPLFLVHFPSCLVLDLCIVFFLKHQPHYSRSVFS